MKGLSIDSLGTTVVVFATNFPEKAVKTKNKQTNKLKLKHNTTMELYTLNC